MQKAILLAVVFLSGCTMALWQPDYKQERVTGFYVNRDTGQLFVTTADTAWIFEIDREFGEALLLSRDVDFYPMFEDFRIDKENRVRGEVTLRLIGHNPPDDLVARLREIGFREGDVLHKLALSREIEGRRYVIEGELPLEKLEEERVVSVAQPATFVGTAGKLIATPVAIAWDGYVTVPTVFLLVSVMATDSF